MGRFSVPESTPSPDGSKEDSSQVLDDTLTSEDDVKDPDFIPEDPVSREDSEGESMANADSTKHVRFDPTVEDTSHGRDILNDLIHHDNIVDFYHIAETIPRKREASFRASRDPDYPRDPPPTYIPRFDDITTLEELIRRGKKPPGLPTSKHPTGLTEPQIWHTLISLLRAVMYLHTGHQVHPRKGEPPTGWMSIVHNDITPANIIFTHPIAKRSKYLPFRFGACKLGNFNRSIVLPSAAEPEESNEEEIRERREVFESLYHGGERSGCEAPELVREKRVPKQDPGPMSDLWSIGAVVVNMMTGRSVWDLMLECEFADKASSLKLRSRGKISERWRDVPLNYRHKLIARMVGTTQVIDNLPRLYSVELRCLVHKLLSVDPKKRGPTARALLEFVEERFDKWNSKGYRIYERHEIDRTLDEETERGIALAIKDAKKYIDGMDERLGMLLA